MNCLIIKMGGSGRRFGHAIPKQFTDIKGKPYFSYIFEDFQKINEIDKYIVVTNPNYMDLTAKYAQLLLGNKLLGVIEGGNSNLKSTYNGVKFASKYLKDEDILLTHDITNSSVDIEAIKMVIETAKKYGAATNGTEQVQTLFTKDSDNTITGTIEKCTIASGYTPEAYQMGLIKSCFDNASEEELMNMTSPLAVIIAKGYKPKIVFSHALPLKLTYDKDMEPFLKLHGLSNWENR